MIRLESKIEAILFWKSGPITRKKLADILNVKPLELNESLEKLKEDLKDRGVVLQEKEDEVALGTSSEVSKLIEDLQKEELNKDLSKASLETLSIVLYKEGASRAEIDYIRGVNSSFTLRLLSVRGLVDKVVDVKDNRRYIYKPSFQLLSYLGIKAIGELPDYVEVSESIKTAAEELADQEKEEQNKE